MFFLVLEGKDNVYQRIQSQLAHTDKNVVRRAYNRADYLEERREMLQAWADYLDRLKAGAQVIPIHQKQEPKAG